MKQWEAEAKNEENYERLQYLMHGGDPYITNDAYLQQTQSESYTLDPNYAFQGEIPQESDRINTDQIYEGEIPDGGTEGGIQLENINNTLNITTGHPINSTPNADIRLDQRSSSQVCNMPVINMNEMLQDHKITPNPSRGAVNSYYSNLSMLGYSKPFFFPPPDLGMVESMGSYENSSRFFRSVKSSNMNKSFGKNTSVIGVSIRNRQNITSGDIDNVLASKTQNSQTDIEENEKPLEASAKKTTEENKDEISETSLKSVDSDFSHHGIPSTEKTEEVVDKPET